MIYKLHTSEATQEIFGKIANTSGLQPYALSKIAIALSVRQGTLQADDFNSDNAGLEISRQTIFGDSDLLFKCLIIQNEGRQISDSEFFPRIVKAHLDRGAKILNNEIRYNKNIYVNLCQLDTNI